MACSVFIGALLAIVVFRIRRGLLETQSFKTLKQKQISRNQECLLYLNIILKRPSLYYSNCWWYFSFYTYTTYLQKYLVNTSGFTKPEATQITTLALFIFMCLQPLAGALSDRIGRKPLMIAFGVTGVLFTYILFDTLANTHNYWTAFWLCLGGLVMVTGYTSINAVVKAELFPAHIRALGVALPYAIANTLFGGTAEFLH